jgi:hypothetical protein
MEKSGPALRAKVDGVWYLEVHPEVADIFKQAGVFTYYEKLTSFHQQSLQVCQELESADSNPQCHQIWRPDLICLSFTKT